MEKIGGRLIIMVFLIFYFNFGHLIRKSPLTFIWISTGLLVRGRQSLLWNPRKNGEKLKRTKLWRRAVYRLVKDSRLSQKDINGSQQGSLVFPIPWYFKDISTNSQTARIRKAADKSTREAEFAKIQKEDLYARWLYFRNGRFQEHPLEILLFITTYTKPHTYYKVCVDDKVSSKKKKKPTWRRK